MTRQESDPQAAEEAFLRQGLGQEPTPAKLPADQRDDSQCPAPQSALDTAVLNAIRTWEQYCVLSISVDLADGIHVSGALDTSLQALIDAVHQERRAVGCLCNEGLYVCVLMNTDTASACAFARQFQERLGHRRQETVTIGIARFPQKMFSRDDILLNACKALDHAAFFGRGSVVSFDATSLNISGDKHYHAGETELAATEYRAGLELAPEDTNLHNSLGVCHAKLGDLTAAAKAFNTVLEIEPGEAMAIYNLGMIAMLQDDLELAQIRFREAYAQNRTIYEIPFQIGRLFAKQGDWQAALEYLDAAIALSDRHWQLYHLKGVCLAGLGETTKAIKAYSRSVKINPADADGFSALGCLYDECDENPDICNAFFQQSIRLNPQNGLFHHRLGRWHQKHQRPDLAREAYGRATALGYDASHKIAALQREDQRARSRTNRCA